MLVAPRVGDINDGDEIDAFLGRYAATLTGETMAQGLEQPYPTYRKPGLASVTHECLDVTDLTEKITLVYVRWHFFDSEGTQLTDSTAYYILRRNDAGVQACVCIQVDDAEKIQALAAERGVDLTHSGPSTRPDPSSTKQRSTGWAVDSRRRAAGLHRPDLPMSGSQLASRHGRSVDC